MKLRVLGSAGAEFPGFMPPAFLVDGQLLLDAGTIGSVLTAEEQSNLHDILITHAHLDHIRAIPALADNVILGKPDHSVHVYGAVPVIGAMRDHLFNDIIWPDFAKIPSSEYPVLHFDTIEPLRTHMIGRYKVLAVEVNHTVPATGYIIECDGKRLAYTGDTGPTDLFWTYASGADALIVEVSFPDSMEPLALLTKHLTCRLLREELSKIPLCPKRILITHPKPQYYEIIREEIKALSCSSMELLHDGAVYDL